MSWSVLLPRRDRIVSASAVLLLPVLGLGLTRFAPAVEIAPAPRTARSATAVETDRALLAEIQSHSEQMTNLQHLSDVIGPRLTGSRNLERANEWAAAKMKEYGLENVRQEPWEIPVGWERGPAAMTIVEPDTRVRCLVAAVGWTPGTKGKLTAEVVVVAARTKAELDKYKGKLKDKVVITSPPSVVAPVTDLAYGPLPPPAKKDAPKKDEPKKTEPKKADTAPAPTTGVPLSRTELDAFLKAEGVACALSDAGKPHGLLVAYGGWKGTDRAAAQDAVPRLCVAHEHYAMLYRLATRPAPAVTKVEVESRTTFVPGPIACFNTVGEVRGAEKPDEFVVVGAHLDSWDLATGTMDNGTGSCVVLETARAVAVLAKQGTRPRRTIRFVLFTGEEQGLHGSRQYVTRHKGEMDRTSAALVHDTGTGRVYGFGVHGQEDTKAILETELVTPAGMDGWRGLDLGGVFGSDHQSFHPAGVPGLACRQDIDEYRLTHHTQTDTFDHAKGPNLIQGAQVMAVTAVRIANLPDLLPRMKTVPKREPKTTN